MHKEHPREPSAATYEPLGPRRLSAAGLGGGRGGGRAGGRGGRGGRGAAQSPPAAKSPTARKRKAREPESAPEAPGAPERIVHVARSDGRFQCGGCGRSFDSAKGLKRHAHVHKKHPRETHEIVEEAA